MNFGNHLRARRNATGKGTGQVAKEQGEHRESRCRSSACCRAAAVLFPTPSWQRADRAGVCSPPSSPARRRTTDETALVASLDLYCSSPDSGVFLDKSRRTPVRIQGGFGRPLRVVLPKRISQISSAAPVGLTESPQVDILDLWPRPLWSEKEPRSTKLTGQIRLRDIATQRTSQGFCEQPIGDKTNEPTVGNP